MPLVNIKRRESVPGQGIMKLKRREQKTVYITLLFKYKDNLLSGCQVHHGACVWRAHLQLLY